MRYVKTLLIATFVLTASISTSAYAGDKHRSLGLEIQIGSPHRHYVKNACCRYYPSHYRYRADRRVPERGYYQHYYHPGRKAYRYKDHSYRNYNYRGYYRSPGVFHYHRYRH